MTTARRLPALGLLALALAPAACGEEPQEAESVLLQGRARRRRGFRSPEGGP